MPEHIILALMLVGQMVIGAIALAYIVREVRYVARLTERILDKIAS